MVPTYSASYELLAFPFVYFLKKKKNTENWTKLESTRERNMTRNIPKESIQDTQYSLAVTMKDCA